MNIFENAVLAKVSQQEQSKQMGDEKLDDLFKDVIRWGIEHTGQEPSISCFGRAVDNLRDYVKSVLSSKQDPIKVITDHEGRPMTYWGGKAAPKPMIDFDYMKNKNLTPEKINDGDLEFFVYLDPKP
jgi:hypothetical protein